MKKLGVLASAALVFFILSTYSEGGLGVIIASSQGEDRAAEGAKSIELSFWTLGNMNFDELAEAYMKEHPDIRITVRSNGDQITHHNNLTIALAAGSGAPDIFQLEIGYMERFMRAEDKFYNLNDLGAKHVQDQYLDWKWAEGASTDGTFQLGLPADIRPMVAYYRADLVEQAGLPADPASLSEAIDTWDKFVTVARQYTEQTGKPFVDSWESLINAVRYQTAGVLHNSQLDDTLIGDVNPQLKKAYDLTVLGIREGWIGESVLLSSEWREDLRSDSFAFIPGASWTLDYLKLHAPETSGQWRIAQLPEGSGNWGGSFFVLPKEGNHPEEAYAFIEWLASKEIQIASFRAKGLMPSILEAYDDPQFLHYQDDFLGGQSPGVEFVKAVQHIEAVQYDPLPHQTEAYLKEALRNVQVLEADPEVEWQAAREKFRRFTLRS